MDVAEQVAELKQEISYTQEEISDREKHIKKCQAEIIDLLGLPSEWKILPYHLLSLAMDAIEAAKQHRAEHGDPFDNITAILGDIDEELFDILNDSDRY